jgi:hypothetical protein
MTISETNRHPKALSTLVAVAGALSLAVAAAAVFSERRPEPERPAALAAPPRTPSPVLGGDGIGSCIDDPKDAVCASFARALGGARAGKGAR